jgi:hypothetical protein
MQRGRSRERLIFHLAASSWLLLLLLLAFPTVSRSFTMVNLNKSLNLFKRTSQSNLDEQDDDQQGQQVLNMSPTASRRVDGQVDSKADAEAYNLLASADVDLSDAFVFNGIFSGRLT